MEQANVGDWQVRTVVEFLQSQFPGRSVDHFARGRAAELFYISEAGRLVHQLYVSRRFLARATDPAALAEALVTTDVVASMRNVGTTTIELH